MLRQFVLSTLLATLPQSLHADTGPSLEPPVDDISWEFTGAAGLALTDGNSDSLAYNLRFLASRITRSTESWLSADYHYADDAGAKSTDALRLGIQHDRILDDRLYLGATSGFLADSIADLDYRFDVATHLGWHMLKNERTRLSFEAGPGYAWEKQGGITEDFVSMRFAQKFSHQLSTHSRLAQSLVVTPQLDDFSNHLIVAEAGFEMRINSRLALNTAVRHSIDNTPAAGRKKHDITLIQGFSYILGGQPAPSEDDDRRSLMPEVEAKSVAPTGWSAEAALGFSLAQGNSDNLNLTLTGETAHRSADGEFFLNTAYGYTENAGTTSIDTLRVNTKYNRFINARWFAGGGLGYFRDPIAGIGFRITPGIHFGRYLIKNDDTTLSVGAGPGFTMEKTGNRRDDFASAQIAQRLAHVVSDRVRVDQSLVYQAKLNDPGNYTVLASFSVDVRMNERLSWRNTGSWHFDNQPAAGKERQDMTLTSGLAVRFW